MFRKLIEFFRLPKITRAQILNVQDGDMLIVHVAARLSPDAQEHFVEKLHDYIGVNNLRIMVVSDAIDFQVLRKCADAV